MPCTFSFLPHCAIVFTMEALSCLGLFSGVLFLKDIMNRIVVLISF